ncbi:hypothetical protein AFLA70_197g002111 [Aspergillus flavus AF70]|nr:hypothetical protein AFLA70_197g002111 [Aspergillus flavus AF70]
MRLFMPITLLLAATLAPTFAAPSDPCVEDQICRYTTDWPMEDFKPGPSECTCPSGTMCTESGTDPWNSGIHHYTCQ